MKRNFKSLFRKFCLESSISVMKYFYLYPDPISRCFWSATMVCMFALAWYLTWLLYTRFTDMPTRITIENQYEPVRALPFPAVTVCSPNQITISAVSHFNKTLVDGNATSDLDRIIIQLLGFYEPILIFNEELSNQLQSLIELNRYATSQVMSLLPQRCDEFIKFCKFGPSPSRNCSELFSPLLTTHGLCCAFNSKYYFNNQKNRNELKPNFVSRLASKASVNSAFTVVVDYNPADALDGTLLNAGAIRILFTDHTEFPADDVSNLVLTNTESLHIIHATYTYCSDDVKILPVSSRKCYLQNERHLPFFREYHNSDCDHWCLVDMVRRLCGCEIFYVPGLHLSQTCNVSSIKCVTKTRLHHLRSISDCTCLRDCESRQYAVEMSLGNLRALPYLYYDMYNGITFNKSTAILHFFFPNTVYVKQKQETVISVVTLISNLGGVFGLCVGCSAMSVVELIFFMYMAINNRIRYRIRKRNRRVVDLKKERAQGQAMTELGKGNAI